MGATQPQPGRASYLAVQAVNIYVRDQEASLRFYVDVLGFDVAFDARMQSGERWLGVAPPDGKTVLALCAPRPDSPEHRLIGRPTGVTFVAEDPLAKYSEWRRRGVHFLYAPRLRRVRYERQGGAGAALPAEEQNTAWGGVFSHFRDPDGNSFALVGFDEVTRQIEAQRHAAAEREFADRRAAHELEIARQVQARLFPQALPEAATLDYAGTCIQAREVGGDYFDFLEFGGAHLGLVVGDIAGKGIAAALLMANLQANLRIQCGVVADRPRALLRSINQVFHRNSTESAYATLFFAEYEDRGRRLRYANCGHLPALLLRAGGTLERLGATGTVLGLFRDWDCGVEERELFPGDTLAVYTDGIVETFNARDEEFGEERLVEVLRAGSRLSPQCLIAAVVDEVRRFGAGEQQDDITLIVARCR